MLTVSLQATASGCGSSDGRITMNPSGGNGNYSYQLNNSGPFITEHEFSGLEPGEYFVLVRDGEGCETPSTINVIAGTSLSSDIMPIVSASCTIGSCHKLLGPSLETKEDLIAHAEKIKSTVMAETMPPPTEPGLSETQISTIICWVEDGALDN